MPNDAPPQGSPVTDVALSEKLAEAEARLSLAQDVGGAYAFEWDLATGKVIASDGFRRLYGVPDGVAVTADLVDARLHEDDRERVLADQKRLLRDGGSYDSEFRIRLPDGKERWILARGHALIGGDGRPRGLAGVNLDITGRKQADQALADSEARFHAMVNAIDQMVWSTRPDGFHDYYNERWYEFTGVPIGSTDGEAWNDLFHPDDRARAREVWTRSLATGSPYYIEYRLRHHAADYRWVIGRAKAMRDTDGAIIRWYGTCTDIHALKEAEEARELIARELSHRIKNIFALVGSLVSLSARGQDVSRPFVDSVRGRIAALARAHEYVRPHGPDSGGPEREDLAGLITLLLAPYQTESSTGGRRVAISGGDLAVGPNSATNLALLLHELATNAVKYGALSASGGTVSITCTERADDVVLVWRERGGPPVGGPPLREGFGTTLSRRVASVQLAASMSEDWDASGLTVTLIVPRATLER